MTATFPEGFRPPSQATIERVNRADVFVITIWNGIPADNSGKRSVLYLTSKVHPWHGVNVWTLWRSQAQHFPSMAAAEEAVKAIKLDHSRAAAKIYPNLEAHVATGGLAEWELT